MKPQRPLVTLAEHLAGTRQGDCWRSCIATIIERPCSEVPHFVEECGERDFVDYTRDWLREQGFDIFETSYGDQWELSDILKWICADNPGIPMILCGHPTGGPEEESHALVILDGKIVHDPGNCGLDGPSKCRPDAPGKDQWWLRIICLAKDWKGLAA